MPSDQFGLGSGTPSRFPYPDRPQPAPGIGPSQGQVVRATLVIVSGFQGVFVYNGKPGPGTLIGSVTDATHDPFGNPTVPTIAAYDVGAGRWTAVTGAGVALGTHDPATTTTVAASITHNDANTPSGQAQLVIESAFTGAGSAVVETMKSASADGTKLTSWQLVTGNLVAITADEATATITEGLALVNTAGTAANPSLVTTDTWQNLGSPSIANTTVNVSQYARMPFGVGTSPMMCIDVSITVNAGGAAAGVYTFASTLAAAYRFPGNYSRSYPVGFNGTITTATNNSDMIIDGAGTANPGRVRLQIPALPVGTVITATLFIPLG